MLVEHLARSRKIIGKGTKPIIVETIEVPRHDYTNSGRKSVRYDDDDDVYTNK